MKALIAQTAKTRKVIARGSAPEIGLALRQELAKQTKRSTKTFLVEHISKDGRVIRTDDRLTKYLYHRRIKG